MMLFLLLTTTTNKALAATGECYFVFPVWTKAGENDIFEQMRFQMSLSSSWGCGTVMPPPVSLVMHVQFDKATWPWSRYVRYPVPGMLLDKSPDEEEANFTVGDPPSLLGDVLGRRSVVRFDNLAAKAQGRFWAVGRGAYERLSAPPMPEPHGFPLFPSRDIVDAANRVLRLHFRDPKDYVAIKIRRGDMVRFYRDECQPHASLVASFLKNVTAPTLFVLVQPLKDGKKTPMITSEYAETELRSYAEALRTAVAGNFENVVFESDVRPSGEENDHFFDFLVNLRIAHGAKTFFSVTPKYSKFALTERPPIEDFLATCIVHGHCRASSASNDDDDRSSLKWLRCPQNDVPDDEKQVLGLVIQNPIRLYTYATVLAWRRDPLPMERHILDRRPPLAIQPLWGLDDPSQTSGSSPGPHRDILTAWNASGFPTSLSTFCWPGHIGG